MKSMENVKPTYAVNLGKGVFAGVKWMCSKCGKQIDMGNNTPNPQSGGRCPDTSSGNHIWQKM
nr:hypothetical protein [uncultured Ruminococcus sp.]